MRSLIVLALLVVGGCTSAGPTPRTVYVTPRPTPLPTASPGAGSTGVQTGSLATQAPEWHARFCAAQTTTLQIGGKVDTVSSMLASGTVTQLQNAARSLRLTGNEAVREWGRVPSWPPGDALVAAYVRMANRAAAVGQVMLDVMAKKATTPDAERAVQAYSDALVDSTAALENLPPAVRPECSA